MRRGQARATAQYPFLDSKPAQQMGYGQMGQMGQMAQRVPVQLQQAYLQQGSA